MDTIHPKKQQNQTPQEKPNSVVSVKQVIIIRKDLGMRRGKEISQGADASMRFLREKIKAWLELGTPLMLSGVEQQFMTGSDPRVCLIVDSEAGLLDLDGKAKAAGLTSWLVKDRGKTEFKGVPMYTALAIGPDEAEKIDAVTGKLALY